MVKERFSGIPFPVLSPEMQRRAEELRGRTIVIKCSGSALKEGSASLSYLAQDAALLFETGIRPVVVHGAGSQITEKLDAKGIKTKFVEGRRVTDKATLRVVIETAREMNQRLRETIDGFAGPHDALAMGLADGIVIAENSSPELGLVGDKIVGVDTERIPHNWIPVISHLGYDYQGKPLNVNADLVAAAVADCLGAEEVVFLSDVDGIFGEFATPDQALISHITVTELTANQDTFHDGMRPKVEACLRALEEPSVESVHIVNASIPHAVLRTLLIGERVGTTIDREIS